MKTDKQPKPYNLDDKILLILLLKQTKQTRREFEQRVIKQFNLNAMTKVDTIRVEHKAKLPGTDQPLYSEDTIYDSGNYLVKTTKYGRIKDIQSKPRSVIKPQVIVKRKRTFQKPQ